MILLTEQLFTSVRMEDAYSTITIKALVFTILIQKKKKLSI